MAGREYIQINLMSLLEETTRRVQVTANLGLDNDTTDATARFLEEQLGELSPTHPDYEVLAATAIVGEVKRIEDVSRQHLTRVGVSVESVMRHIGKRSKEKFLEEVQRLSKKWREAPAWLLTKIDNVKMSYRIYKKYRLAFEELTRAHTWLEDQPTHHLQAIFWILYIFVKNEHTEIDNTLEAITLLHSLFLFLFSEPLAQLPHQQLTAHFHRHFANALPPSPAHYDLYRDMLLTKLASVHTWRYERSHLDLQQLVTSQPFMMRYLDDISNLYDKFKTTLPEGHVDEISFLELNKTLTPLTIKRNLDLGTITKKIDFFNDDDDHPDPPPPEPPAEDETLNFAQHFSNRPYKGLQPNKYAPASPFMPSSNHNAPASETPVAARQQNLSWVNKILTRFTEQELQKVKSAYESNTHLLFGQFEQLALGRIMQSISEFTPACIDTQKRQRSIYHFYAHFINLISEEHAQPERQAIFEKEQSFHSILCLATDLFNYAYHSLQSSYREYCRIFGIGLLEGQKPINWFGSNCNMPHNIKEYLYSLEKKILIQEIWEDQTGFSLITADKTNYHIHTTVRRLKRHVDQRTQELCKLLHIDQAENNKIANLVKFVVDQRQTLLLNHQIDQIIVCSIASTLSVNRSRNQRSLEEIFRSYSQLTYSYQSTRNATDPTGNQIDLIDYYNETFLPMFEQILAHDDQARSILTTPVRLERKTSQEMGLEMTPIPLKYRQSPLAGRRQKRESHEDTSYRNRIVQSLSNLHIAEQVEDNDLEEDMPSPTFRNLAPSLPPRTFSFGDFDKF